MEFYKRCLLQNLQKNTITSNWINTGIKPLPSAYFHLKPATSLIKTLAQVFSFESRERSLYYHLLCRTFTNDCFCISIKYFIRIKVAIVTMVAQPSLLVLLHNKKRNLMLTLKLLNRNQIFYTLHAAVSTHLNQFLKISFFTSNLINTGLKNLPSAYFYDFFSFITYSHRSHQGLSWAQQYFLCLVFQGDQRPVVSRE